MNIPSLARVAMLSLRLTIGYRPEAALSEYEVMQRVGGGGLTGLDMPRGWQDKTMGVEKMNKISG